MESWRIASSRKQGVEAKIVRSSRKVTQRTKQRVYKLETCSTNRHFLMRLTGNRIKWTGTMTEIAWVAFTLVMTRILFLPFLTSNPFMPSNYGMEHNAQQMIPQQQNDQLLSIADSMLFAFTSWFYSRAVTHLRRKVKQHAIKFLTHALIRPWEASNRLQKAFAVARWTKFLAPLVGTSNKLRGHYIDYLRKTAQKRRSDNAQFRWEEMARSIRSERQLERAVRRIQKAFRLQRQIKLVSVRPPANAHTLKGIVSLQRRFRSRSALNRLRILRAKSRLSGIGPAKRILSCDTGLLIDDLKKEIRTRTRKTRTLLIRPNTCFSVWWKRMTIVCVVIEIAQLLLAPKLAPHLQKVPVVELVLHLLTPIYIIDPSAPYLKVWLYFVGIFSRCTSDAVRLISFLDVFVTFFTGDLDSATGLLIPKPLVTRWIIPGVALQLLANPAMKDVSQIARRGVVFVNSVGPVRVFHALVALLPALHFLVENAIDTLYTFVCVRTGTQHRCDGTCGHSHKS